MTITWAYAENAVAILIGVVEERCGPVKGWDKLPLAAESKAECLKDVFRDTPALKTLRQDGRRLAIRFKSLSKRRNDLTHGAAWQTSNASFKSVAIKIKAGENVIHDHSFDHRDAGTLVAEITVFSDELMLLLLKTEMALR